MPTPEIRLPDGRTVDSPAAASAAGYDIACEAFALCGNVADRFVAHPALVLYPSCARCAARLG